MSDELSRFLATSAPSATRTTYNAITANQVVHNTTIHVHMAPENATSKRRKQNPPPIAVDPTTFGGTIITEEICRVLDPNRSALVADRKLLFFYPVNIHKVAAAYDEYAKKAQAHPDASLSSIPPNYGNAVLQAAMAAQALLDENDKPFIEDLSVVNPSDPNQSQSFFQLLWRFYTRNPIALAAFMAPPNDRKLAAQNWKAFLAPCPLCNSCCAAFRDRLNQDAIFLPTSPKRRSKDETPTLHDDAVTKYLTIPRHLKHCQEINDQNKKHRSFVVLHRILGHFYTILDTGVAPDFQPLHKAIAADFAAIQIQEEILDNN